MSWYNLPTTFYLLITIVQTPVPLPYLSIVIFGPPLGQCNVKHDRRVVGQIVDVAGGRVHEDNLTVRRDAVALVYVPKHVVPGLDALLHRRQQLNAAGAHPRAAQVAVADGGRVRHQDVQVLRDLLPLFQAVLAALHVERPLAELGLPGRAVDFEPVQLDALVLRNGSEI